MGFNRLSHWIQIITLMPPPLLVRSRGFFQQKLTLVALLLLSSCNSNTPSGAPQPVVWDRDVCEHCGMVVSERRYASQLVDQKGHKHLFDDVGCAIEWKKDHGDLKIQTFWTMDRNTLKWINATQAHWSYGSQTPMGYGFSATKGKGTPPLAFKQVQEKVLLKSQMRRQVGTPSSPKAVPLKLLSGKNKNLKKTNTQ